MGHTQSRGGFAYLPFRRCRLWRSARSGSSSRRRLAGEAWDVCKRLQFQQLHIWHGRRVGPRQRLAVEPGGLWKGDHAHQLGVHQLLIGHGSRDGPMRALLSHRLDDSLDDGLGALGVFRRRTCAAQLQVRRVDLVQVQVCRVILLEPGVRLRGPPPAAQLQI